MDAIAFLRYGRSPEETLYPLGIFKDICQHEGRQAKNVK